MKGIPDSKLIYFDKRKGTYVITKNIFGKKYNFGTYKSLKDAREARNYFEENGWLNCLDERLKFTYKKPKYIIWLKNRRVWQIRKWINGKYEIFGQFKNYDDAVEEVELLKEVNWDWEALCSLKTPKSVIECPRCGRSYV